MEICCREVERVKGILECACEYASLLSLYFGGFLADTILEHIWQSPRSHPPKFPERRLLLLDDNNHVNIPPRVQTGLQAYKPVITARDFEDYLSPSDDDEF